MKRERQREEIPIHHERYLDPFYQDLLYHYIAFKHREDLRKSVLNFMGGKKNK